MSDARWGDPRQYGERKRGDERPRVYDDRDRDDCDPRDGLMNAARSTFRRPFRARPDALFDAPKTEAYRSFASALASWPKISRH